MAGRIQADPLGEFHVGVAVETGDEVAIPNFAIEDIVFADEQGVRFEDFTVIAGKLQFDLIPLTVKSQHDIVDVGRFDETSFPLADHQPTTVGELFHLAHEKFKQGRIFKKASLVPEIAFGIYLVMPNPVFGFDGIHVNIVFQFVLVIQMKENDLIFGEDFYYNEDGFMVFTAAYLLKRGYCCQSGCRHCPYGFEKDKKEVEVEK